MVLQVFAPALAALVVAAGPASPVRLERSDALDYDVRTGRAVATGDVRIVRDSWTIEADRATIQGTLVEADGDVRIGNGEDLVRGTRAVYDLRGETGTVEDARGVWGGVHVAADRLVVTDSRSAVAEGGLVSPCDLEGAFAPIFQARRFEILRGRRIRSRLLRVRIGPVPVFFFPLLSLPAPDAFPGRRTAPSVRLAAGRGDFEGAFAKTGVDYDVGRFGRGTLRADFRSHVGWAFGEDHLFEIPGGRGTLATTLYWVDVRDARDRSRGRARLRGDLTDRLSIRAQLHGVSDRNVRRDFFFTEFIEEEPPANDATLTYRGRSWVGRLTWVGNPNRDLFDETERMPEAEVRFLPRRLPGGLVAEAEGSVARLGFEDARGGDTEYVRGRVRGRLSRPIPIGFTTLTPYASADVARYTRDDRSIGDGTRSLPAVGATLETLLVGRWGANWRHVVRPAVTYEHVERKGLDAAFLIVRDPEDRPRDGDVVTIEMDHRFVRRTPRGEIRRLGRVLLSTFWDADRPRDRWGDVRIDARITPNPRLAVSLDAAYNPNENVVERADLSVGYRADSWGASLALVRSNGRTAGGDQLQVEGEVDAALADRWSGRIRIKFDAEEGTLDSGRYGLTYRGPCWTVGLGFEDHRQVDRDTAFLLLGLTPFGGPAEVSFGGL